MDKPYRLFKTYPHLHLANLDLIKLKDEGIEAHAIDQNMGSYGFESVAVGGVKVFVLEEDYERAVEVLGYEKE